MLRNKEFLRLLLIMLFISSVSVAVTFYYSSAAGVIMLATSILLIACTLFFTWWRYREIEKLSHFLRRITSGDYSLNVRDNEEGELSILKNDIYKVTLMLSEQGSYLQKDKIMLTDAISDISHQLKTPLTSMMVMSDLLRADELSIEKRKEFTRNIRVQLERIEWLVSSLLKLSKIDAGTAFFKKEAVSVNKLVEKSLEPLLIPMDIKEQTVNIVGEEHVTFQGDFNWTVEAVLNILKNCVEHTNEFGKINISFSENPIFTEIIIADNGKGIGKEDLPYIFKRFYRGKNAGEDSVGIGLAMAHSIITRQNGAIEVKSEVGKGTQFHIKFYKQIT